MDTSLSNEKIEELGTANISILVRKYVIPSVVGTIVFAVLNQLNTLLVAHGPQLGEHAVGSMGISLPIILIGSALSMLTGSGAAARWSIAAGRGDVEEAQYLVGNAVTLSCILFIPAIAAFFWLQEPILNLIGVTPETAYFTIVYLQMLLPFAVLFMLSMSMNHFIRVSGHPVKAMLLALLTVVINVILLPIVIFWLKWGIHGVAIANALSGVILFGVTFYHFLRRGTDLPMKLSSLRLRKKTVASILSLGISPFLVQLIAALVVFVINNRLKVYGGATSIEAYTIANQFCVILVLTLGGVSQGVQPIIGYNYGARIANRVQGTLRISLILNFTIGLFGWLLLGVIFPDFFIALFGPSPELYAQGVLCLSIISIGLPLSGLQMVVISFFQSIGSAMKAFYLSLMRQIAFLIPLVLILPQIWGTRGVWYSLPISDVISTLVAIVVLLLEMRVLKKTFAYD